MSKVFLLFILLLSSRLLFAESLPSQPTEHAIPQVNQNFVQLFGGIHFVDSTSFKAEMDSQYFMGGISFGQLLPSGSGADYRWLLSISAGTNSNLNTITPTILGGFLANFEVGSPAVNFYIGPIAGITSIAVPQISPTSGGWVGTPTLGTDLGFSFFASQNFAVDLGSKLFLTFYSGDTEKVEQIGKDGQIYLGFSFYY